MSDTTEKFHRFAWLSNQAVLYRQQDFSFVCFDKLPKKKDISFLIYIFVARTVFPVRWATEGVSSNEGEKSFVILLRKKSYDFLVFRSMICDAVCREGEW